MRLFEVEDRFANDLEMVLRNQMGRSNTKHSSLKLTYPALSNMMKNMGYGEVDYDSFKKMYDANPSLKNIVRNFNDVEVIVTTDAEKPKDKQGVTPEEPGGPTVDQMASSGAQAALNNPLA